MRQKRHKKPAIPEPIERDDEHHIERHATFLKRIQTGPIGLLFLGDSIVRRWAEVPDLWQTYFSRYNPANFGVGSDLIQNLKWRILNGELEGISPRIVVVLIGTNNLPISEKTEIYIALRDLIEIVHQKLPETKIILMGLLPRNPDETAKDYLHIIPWINRKLKKLRKSGYVHFLDLGKEFLNPDGRVAAHLIPDGLHLIRPGYEIWGKYLRPVIEKYFQDAT